MKSIEESPITPCAAWTDDCQGKKDYDGRLVSITSRYWPFGGGFHISRAGGDFRLSQDQSIRPSASAAIVINHGTPDEPDGYANSITLASAEFEGDSETEVRQQVESWVAEKAQEVAAVLRKHFWRQG